MDFALSTKADAKMSRSTPMRISAVSAAIESVVPYELTHAVASALRVPVFSYITREDPIYMTLEQFFVGIADVTKNSPDHERILDRLPGYLAANVGGLYDDLLSLRAEISENEKLALTKVN